MRLIRLFIACLMTFLFVLIPSANAGLMHMDHAEKAHCALLSKVHAASDHMHHSINNAQVNVSTDCERHGSTPVKNDNGCCAFGAACSLKCFGAALTTSEPILFPQIVIIRSAFADETFQPFDRGLPPFRPPRF